ncbi:hypothetical protein PENSUB_13808 [Penicillium subrubescens]|uniref:Uncharacterized protein n=1 Tax=Penicillium subrubescens TaxID=1316194 RepID=A0A1Q5SMW6_9EURO|nr:hypothetical protein PENSUB_13808 [Penicillium subrubescens]
MPGGNGGPGEGIGNSFLRSKAEKRGMNGFTVFITELLPASRRENVMSVVVEEDQEEAWARVTSRDSRVVTGERDHVVRPWMTEQAVSQ